MANELSLETLRKNSRKAAIGTALGAVIVFGAIVFSAVRLANLDKQIDEKTGELICLNKEFIDLEGQLAAKRKELNQVQSWGDLFRVCALGGQIAIAQTKDEAQSAYAELTEIRGSVQKLGDALDADERTRAENVVRVIDELKPLVENWNDEERWVKSNLRLKIIELGSNAKKVFENAPPAVSEFRDELARLLYDQAIAVAVRLHFADAEQWDKQPTRSDRDEFWRLYWGDLVFIESGAFEDAMISVRNAIAAAEGTKPTSLTKEISQLAKAYKKELNRWPRLPPSLMLDLPTEE